jgi:uncharacterized protein YciI
MLYLMIGTDVDDSIARRAEARPAHLARLEQLKEAGRLVLAGPTPAIDSAEPGPAGMSGSVIVAEFESLDTAREWAAADPYVNAGVFSKVEVKPFIKVLP